MITAQTLTTDRLILHPLTLEDADSLYALYSDVETMRFMPSTPHTNPVQTRNTLQFEMICPGALHWTIRLKNSETPIGIIHFLGQTNPQGMGYILQRDFWNQGIATEACRAALAFGFEQCNYDKVELWINNNNHASQRVANKLGFTLNGRLNQQYEHEANHHVMYTYGLHARTWRGEGASAEKPRLFEQQTVLMVHNVGEAAVYFRDKLGFNIDYLYQDNHAGISYGEWTGAKVAFQLSKVPSDRELGVSTYTYIFVDALIDNLCKQYRANGVEIVQEPETFPYGMREFAVRVIGGHLLKFGTHAA